MTEYRQPLFLFILYIYSTDPPSHEGRPVEENGSVEERKKNEGNAEKVPEELGKERVGNKCGKVKTRYFRKDEEERNVNENEEKKR